MDVSEILSELVDHGFEDTSTERKLAKINDAIWDIESREPWPFLEKTVALNFDGSSPTPTNMPSDFKTVLWLYDTMNGVTIWPERLSTIRDRYGNQLNQVGSPASYYFIGNTLRLYPVPPASTGRIHMDYVATQPEVNANTTSSQILIPARHHQAIVLGALWRLYKMEDDPENGNMFQIDYENRIQQMREDLFRRQYQRADQIYVIDEDEIFDYYNN
jgi:hypothetical protein